MTTRFIIFLYPGLIGGYEILGKQCQWISVDGMREMECHSASDVDSYVERILDTYNLEDLSELDAHYILVDAGSAPEVKEHVVKAFRKCHIDLVTVDTILPFLIMSNQVLAPGGDARVHMGGAFADRWFRCIVEQDGMITAQRDASSDKSIEVEEKDFAVFALPNAESFNGKQKWIRLLESEQKRAQKNEMEFKRVQEKYASDASRLKDELEKAQEKYASDVSRLKDELTKAQEKHASDVSRLKDELAKAQKKYASDVCRLKDELTKAQEKHASDVSRLKDVLTKAQEKHASDVSRPKDTPTNAKNFGPWQNIEVGDKISCFGRFWGKSLTWLVLERQGTKILLLSDSSICNRAFHNSGGYHVYPWHSSSLRTWLNGEFFQSSFTNNEKRKILYSDNRGESDRIFLLSIEEVNEYLKDYRKRDCKEWWWLRSACGDKGYRALTYEYYGTQGIDKVAGICAGGAIDKKGCDAYLLRGVRPALWLDTTL